MAHPRLRERLTAAAAAAMLIAAAFLLVTDRAPTHPDETPNADQNVDPPDHPAPGDGHAHPPDDASDHPDSTHPPAPAEQPDPPLSPGEIKRAAEAASGFVLVYTSRPPEETPEERAERLAPLLTKQAAGLLVSGSSGLAEVHEQAARGETATSELAFLEPIDVTAEQAVYLVSVTVTVHAAGQPATSAQRAYTVTLQRHPEGWLVTDLLPS